MNQEYIIKNIKALASYRGMKHKEVAEKAGYSVKCFSAMMNNRRVIRGTDILPIANVLGVTPNEVLCLSARIPSVEALEKEKPAQHNKE